MNKNQKPHKKWVYFIDRSLPKKSLLSALKEKERQVKHHDELFPPDAPDVEWLKMAGEKG